MNVKRITDDFYISGQVGFSDLTDLAEQGIKSIICARPDDEEGNQPRFADLAKEAKSLNIKMLHVPIRPGQASAGDVTKFGSGYAKLQKPILGYCRSGMRAQSLWELSQKATATHAPMSK
ncbi:TIGR01244 family sulfur transferase [Maritalea sp.]|uniref:TIGR01244 family sulfur transferase n=1 Tax=Maritalea sp. TaxID=2003361 RepID=UPI0039E6D8D8